MGRISAVHSPLRVFMVFALGIILPGGFLSYLGLRSFQYEGMLMQKQTEEHFAAVADLMQRKAGDQCFGLVNALAAAIPRDLPQKLNFSQTVPFVLSTVRLANLPVETLYLFDDQDRMLAPWSADWATSEKDVRAPELDWGFLREEVSRLERLEFVDKNIRQAVEGYAALQSSKLSPALQAALLKNIAGGYRKLHEVHLAEDAYLKLIRDYDQLPDFSGYPMGIMTRQLLAGLYQSEKAWDQAQDVRLDLFEGLLLHRWTLSSERRRALMDELQKAIGQGFANRTAGSSERRERWERLQSLERQLNHAQPSAEAFTKKAWPDLERRLRARGWRDQGGVFRFSGPADADRLVVIAPIAVLASGQRAGFLVAVVQAGAFWPLIEQSLTEFAQPVGLQVAWENAPGKSSSFHPPMDAVWKPTLQRSIDRLDPPLQFRLIDANSREHDQLFRRRRWIYGGIVALSFIVIIVGLAVMGQAVKRETELANLKADFVATVSHELRTPLAAISHIGERLSLGRYRSEDERKEFYGLLGKETHRLRNLIEDILDFSKMLAGRKVYKRETLDAAALMQDALESFEGKATALGFDVLLDLPPQTLSITGDRRALLQAILNLLDNALKYSGESRKINVRLKQAGDRCIMEVEDYGMGIPDAEKERIFEKFYRVEGALAHASDTGVGLGLAMVKHIVEGHQGRIRVESTPGQGSRFILEFPLMPT